MRVSSDKPCWRSMIVPASAVITVSRIVGSTPINAAHPDENRYFDQGQQNDGGNDIKSHGTSYRLISYFAHNLDIRSQKCEQAARRKDNHCNGFSLALRSGCWFKNPLNKEPR